MPLYPSDSEIVRHLFLTDLSVEESRNHTSIESRIDALNLQARQISVNPEVHLELAGCHRRLGDHSTALEALRVGVLKHPFSDEIQYALLRMLQNCGQDEEALAVGERACALMPNEFSLQLEYHLYLPKLYDSEAEILAYRGRFEEGLEKCVAKCDLQTRKGILQASRGFSRYTCFYLAYQGLDNLAPSRRYGEFLHSVMSAAYSQRTTRSEERRFRARAKPLVGFVSAYFREHTVGRHFLGWLTQRDRNLYRAHCYYVGDSQDQLTGDYRRASDSFFYGRNLATAREAIRSDRPDILVFTDVGMDPLTSQIAALRLAPVQCVAYGHPVTTGLPTVDYFISGELMEASNAQENYSEKLILLPKLGIFFTKPIIPRPLLTKTRSDFGLTNETVIYLCCQSVFKYLPQFDHLFARIALAVPRAKFVFIVPNELFRRRFMRRLDRAFSTFGLRAVDFCHALGELRIFDYWNLNLISDVFLDTVAWSGGRSTLDAVACGLPIVTLPGQLMRQRQATAILALLGIEETIAKDEAEYVAIAARLGMDPPWRRAITSRMRSGHRSLFSDHSPIRGLESFIQRQSASTPK